MPQSNERSQVLSYPTPLPRDLIFYQTVQSELPKNGRGTWEYGDPHPDKAKYPSHFLVFVTPADDVGMQKWYYAAKRECQDLYNFEWTDADIGGERFETVSRDYVTLRDEFDAVAPAMGALMPNVPQGRFAPGSDDPTVADFVLAGRKQGQIQQQELNAMFVVEHLVYAKRSTLSNVKIDLQTGRSKYSISKWYYRGEVVDGTPIETLAANPNNPYWGLQEDGVFRELAQPTTNWFVITESTAVPAGSENSAENPAKTRVVTFPTPNGPGRTTPLRTDVLFVEKGTMPDPAPTYGTPHYDATKWPNHKLVYVKPADETGLLFEFYYAADRIDQDLYNFEDVNGESFVRTYLLTRAEYLDPTYFATQKAKVGDAIVGRFDQYVFADESVDRSVQELDGLYVIVKRRFLQKTRTRQFYDDDLDSDITESVVVIEAGTGSSSSSPGSVTEIQPVNIWHDLRITTTVVGFSGSKTLPTLIKDIPYRFPDLLKAATWVGCSAIAQSSAAATSYSESWYIYYDLVEPTGGPFEARVRRFLVAAPDSLRATYPIQPLVTKRETIGQARAYFIASDKGNTTFARAEQLEVPASIHGDITIGNSDIGFALGQYTDKIAATPNFAEFSLLTEMTIGYESQKTRYGLYIVEITQLNLSGVYNGRKVPFGSETPGDSGVGDVSTAIVPPATPNVTLSADNQTITGTTSGLTEVRATVGTTEVGRAMSDASGEFTMALYPPYYTDVVTVLVTARRSGVSSPPRPVPTFDLAPLAPSATISTDLSTVSGTTEPGAEVRILVNGAAQVETATVLAFRPQVETLTFAGTITTDGDIQIDFTSAAVTGSPITVLFGILVSDSLAQVAVKARNALSANPAINAEWAFTTSGADLIATARVTTTNDTTAEMDLTDPNLTGITPATSVNTTAGNAPVTVTTTGNAELTVTSALIPGSPLIIRFAVTSGDTPTQVATKAAAALTASVANNYYIAASSTNTYSLTARTLAATDNSLNIALSNFTSVGLIPLAESVQTTPGGLPATTIANGSGVYSYAFSPVLSNGDALTITATDAGGTSPATVVTASTTPPTLASAAFPGGDYDSITGSASVASVVRAFVNNIEVGNATTSGGGTYNITLATPLIRGERVEVVATDAGTPTIRSASIYIFAYILNLEKPTYEFSKSLGFYGVAPVGATAIIVRYPDNSEHPATLFPTSRNFTFRLDGFQNGEIFEVFARYPLGDSDPVYEQVETVQLDGTLIQVYDRTRLTKLVNEVHGSETYKRATAPDTSWDGYMMHITPPEGATLADIIINFPGSDTPQVVAPATELLAPFTGLVQATGPFGAYNGPWKGPVLYQNNVPNGTGDSALKALFDANLPPALEIICTTSDGRQSTTTFDRTEYTQQYNNNGFYP